MINDKSSETARLRTAFFGSETLITGCLFLSIGTHLSSGPRGGLCEAGLLLLLLCTRGPRSLWPRNKNL